jgi:ribosomal protein S17E
LNDPYIKECKLCTSEGTEISSKEKIDSKNIIFENFDKEKAYSDITTFKIILTDRFDLTYEKEFETNKKGVTEVTIDDTNRTKQLNDIFRLMNKKINQLKE